MSAWKGLACSRVRRARSHPHRSSLGLWTLAWVTAEASAGVFDATRPPPQFEKTGLFSSSAVNKHQFWDK
jgi:hypothetical protein